MTLGLQIPDRLVGFAQSRKNEPKRLAIVIDDPMASGPLVDAFMRMIDTCAELLPAGIVIEPKAIAWDELPRKGRHLDQLANETTRCSDPAVTHTNMFVLSTSGASLDIGYVDGSRSGFWRQSIVKALQHSISRPVSSDRKVRSGGMSVARR
ncbi:hypothetical protein [Mesorhizobium mediterraneum]|uniref:hypothetical protein n=2 Tax=Mesorhizobium TaxID=68287 RepID=UPI001FD992C0|nr:hypothetical protein [Mesorhizobium mediterraneum]